MSETSNMSDLRSVLRKVSNMKALIDIEAINMILITMITAMNAAIIFLNHKDLCCNIFNDFMIKSCILESV